VVRHAVRVFAKNLLLKAVDVGDMAEDGVWKDEV
jgi:hypothetical protein